MIQMVLFFSSQKQLLIIYLFFTYLFYLFIYFSLNPGVREICESYVVGLQWVLYYYYEGVASWSWFYPYHYAPMISDLVDLSSIKMDFKLGKPFRPFDQLLSVLPSASIQHLPSAFHVCSSFYLFFLLLFLLF